MGVRNVRATLTPLHAEMEALLWAMECMRNLRQFQVTFATDCSQLVKMVSEPEEWPAFASYLEDIKNLKESFIRSEIIHVPRTQNTKADKLACSVRIQLSFVVHMDQHLPDWFIGSMLLTKKKKIFGGNHSRPEFIDLGLFSNHLEVSNDSF